MFFCKPIFHCLISLTKHPPGHKNYTKSFIIPTSPGPGYISFQEALSRFSYKTSDSCPSSNESSSFCPSKRSIDGACTSASLKTYKELSEYISTRSAPVPFVGEKEFFFPWEKTILSFPTLQVTNTSCGMGNGHVVYISNNP